MSKLFEDVSTGDMDISDELKRKIEEIEKSEKRKNRERELLFSSKGKWIWEISGNGLCPSPVCYMSGKMFGVKYKQQLMKGIMNDKQVGKIAVLLLLLMDKIKEGNYPIRLSNSGFKKFDDKLNKAMDDFFNDNWEVLDEMYEMFEGKSKVEGTEGA